MIYPGDLVTLQQASDHLRRDTDDDDSDLRLKIMAASSAIYAYLKSGSDLFTDTAGYLVLDSAGDPVGVPYQVKAATLLMVGYLYKQRDEDTDKEFEQGYLPRPVTALLYPLRDPALA